MVTWALTWCQSVTSPIDSSSWQWHWMFDWTIAKTQRPASICKMLTWHQWSTCSSAFGPTCDQPESFSRPSPDEILNRTDIWRATIPPPFCIHRFEFCPIYILGWYVSRCPIHYWRPANSMDWSARKNALHDSNRCSDRISVWLNRCHWVSSFWRIFGFLSRK